MEGPFARIFPKGATGDPKAAQREPKGEGSKRNPKVVPKGAKGAKVGPKGATGTPKTPIGSQRGKIYI